MPNRVLRNTTKSQKVNKLTHAGEVFFYRLMMNADDHGCFDANVKLVKAALYPLRDKTSDRDVSNWIKECDAADLIELYSHDNKPYMMIKDFGQRLRAMKSRFPLPPGLKLAGKAPKQQETPETNFIRIKDQVIKQPVSTWLKENKRIYLEQWQMKNKQNIINDVFAFLDTKYFGYSFNNENHIINTFGKAWDEIAKAGGKVPGNSQQSTSHVFGKRKNDSAQ